MRWTPTALALPLAAALFSTSAPGAPHAAVVHAEESVSVELAGFPRLFDAGDVMIWWSTSPLRTTQGLLVSKGAAVASLSKYRGNIRLRFDVPIENADLDKEYLSDLLETAAREGVEGAVTLTQLSAAESAEGHFGLEIAFSSLHAQDLFLAFGKNNTISAFVSQGAKELVAAQALSVSEGRAFPCLIGSQDVRSDRGIPLIYWTQLGSNLLALLKNIPLGICTLAGDCMRAGSEAHKAACSRPETAGLALFAPMAGAGVQLVASTLNGIAEGTRAIADEAAMAWACLGSGDRENYYRHGANAVFGITVFVAAGVGARTAAAGAVKVLPPAALVTPEGFVFAGCAGATLSAAGAAGAIPLLTILPVTGPTIEAASVHRTMNPDDPNGHFTKNGNRQGARPNGRHLPQVSEPRVKDVPPGNAVRFPSPDGSVTEMPLSTRNAALKYSVRKSGIPDTPEVTRTGAAGKTRHVAKKIARTRKKPPKSSLRRTAPADLHTKASNPAPGAPPRAYRNFPLKGWDRNDPTAGFHYELKGRSAVSVRRAPIPGKRGSGAAETLIFEMDDGMPFGLNLSGDGNVRMKWFPNRTAGLTPRDMTLQRGRFDVMTDLPRVPIERSTFTATDNIARIVFEFLDGSRLEVSASANSFVGACRYYL